MLDIMALAQVLVAVFVIGTLFMWWRNRHVFTQIICVIDYHVIHDADPILVHCAFRLPNLQILLSITFFFFVP